MHNISALPLSLVPLLILVHFHCHSCYLSVVSEASSPSVEVSSFRVISAAASTSLSSVTMSWSAGSSTAAAGKHSMGGRLSRSCMALKSSGIGMRAQVHASAQLELKQACAARLICISQSVIQSIDCDQSAPGPRDVSKRRTTIQHRMPRNVQPQKYQHIRLRPSSICTILLATTQGTWLNVEPRQTHVNISILSCSNVSALCMLESDGCTYTIAKRRDWA